MRGEASWGRGQRGRGQDAGRDGARMRGEGAEPGRGCARYSERRRRQDSGCAGTAGSGLGWTPPAGARRPENKSGPVFSSSNSSGLGRGRGARPGGQRSALSKCPSRGAPGRWAELGRAGSGGAGLSCAARAPGSRGLWGPDRMAPAVVMAVSQPSGFGAWS